MGRSGIISLLAAALLLLLLLTDLHTVWGKKKRASGKTKTMRKKKTKKKKQQPKANRVAVDSAGQIAWDLPPTENQTAIVEAMIELVRRHQSETDCTSANQVPSLHRAPLCRRVLPTFHP